MPGLAHLQSSNFVTAEGFRLRAEGFRSRAEAYRAENASTVPPHIDKLALALNVNFRVSFHYNYYFQYTERTVLVSFGSFLVLNDIVAGNIKEAKLELLIYFYLLPFERNQFSDASQLQGA